MQTFLPYQDFKRSVRALDTKRLGKQRVEAYQIIKSLEIPGYGYAHHPIKLLWAGHLDALKFYHNCCLNEWRLRGRHNSMNYYKLPKTFALPIFPEALHASHRSNLFRKDPSYYEVFAHETNALEYVWCKPIGETLCTINL